MNKEILFFMLKDLVEDGMSFIEAKMKVKSYFVDYKPAKQKKVYDLIDEIRNRELYEKLADKNEEKIKVLDEKGVATGKYLHRKEIHKKENLIWHNEVATVLLNKAGELLIIKRSSAKKSYPSCWGLIAGHVVGDESLLKSALYETSEEVNTPFKESMFIRILNSTKNEREDNKCFITPYIAASVISPNFFTYQETEVSGFQWVSVDEFEKMVENKNGDFNVIFKNNNFYKKLIINLRKIITTPNWYSMIFNCEYNNIHNILGISTPENEVEVYEKNKV